MIAGKLTNDNPESEVFQVYGDAFICVKSKGSGTVTIMRKIGANFEPMTTDTGVQMTFGGDGVLFNSVINSSKRLAYKLVGSGEIEYQITMEDR